MSTMQNIRIISPATIVLGSTYTLVVPVTSVPLREGQGGLRTDAVLREEALHEAGLVEDFFGKNISTEQTIENKAQEAKDLLAIWGSNRVTTDKINAASKIADEFLAVANNKRTKYGVFKDVLGRSHKLTNRQKAIKQVKTIAAQMIHVWGDAKQVGVGEAAKNEALAIANKLKSDVKLESNGASVEDNNAVHGFAEKAGKSIFEEVKKEEERKERLQAKFDCDDFDTELHTSEMRAATYSRADIIKNKEKVEKCMKIALSDVVPKLLEYFETKLTIDQAMDILKKFDIHSVDDLDVFLHVRERFYTVDEKWNQVEDLAQQLMGESFCPEKIKPDHRSEFRPLGLSLEDKMRWSSIRTVHTASRAAEAAKSAFDAIMKAHQKGMDKMDEKDAKKKFEVLEERMKQAAYRQYVGLNQDFVEAKA